jgi:beta-aspartyl-peptidase (threonine type)
MADHKIAIIVHGGAGRWKQEQKLDSMTGCREAALYGWRVLLNGGSALDAVEAAIVALEDNPLFKAGIGSPLNEAGEVELDASIMDGSQLAAGAVAAVQGIRNPITLARKILEDGRHVLLASEGAKRFARQAGVPECDPDELIVEAQRQRWQEKHGTVGCVAVDGVGHIAAGTSTGGLFDKLPGRVSDSALIGCGTYADKSGGVSCTGIGEAIIRVVMGKTAVEFLKQGLSPDEAARQALALLEEKTGKEAGLILIDRKGRFGYTRNTVGMPVCVVHGDGDVVTDF